MDLERVSRCVTGGPFHGELYVPGGMITSAPTSNEPVTFTPIETINAIAAR
jgi:hypothetical protein